ncbi:uncharacterized protein EI90DRAFT_3021907 [Cantharellus anzutake]|uniref:uncharacterized protein n=1 Tax=Cantharellus anzutake TaxID=1750568 RepID=UPI001907EA61|nr:uncharacterized protein EI90DRAFT_3021907 [Cantharellus anzutake]KAF8315516.1 hypothetical protein EI90DRAFT_3021907 [Cantharellus anzutake]
MAQIGFQLEPVARRNTHSITYLNVYHTEKQLTYQLAGRSVTKELGADVILNSKAPDGGSKWFQGMYSLYGEAAQKKFSVSAPGHVGHPADILWEFKQFRLLALNWICKWQQDSGGSLASKEMSLALKAAALWMMNALNSWPKDNPAFKALADYVLPHTEDVASEHLFTDMPALLPDTFTDRAARDHGWEPEEGEEGDGNEIEWFSYMPFGMFMTRALVLQPETDCPRLEYSPWRCISRDHWPFLLKYDLQTLRLKTSKIQLIAERHPDHVPWSTRPTRLIEEPPIHGGADDSFNLDDLREALVGGVKGGRGAHIRLGKTEREEATLEIFADLDLACVFMHCKVQECSTTEWRHNVGIFFLDKGAVVPASATGWKGMAYWTSWGLFKEDSKVSARLVNKIRGEIVRRLDTLAWLPLAEPDRPWTTRSQAHGTLYPSDAPASTSAPIILLHPRKRLRNIQWIHPCRSERSEHGVVDDDDSDT